MIEFDVAGSGKERVKVNLDIYDVRGRRRRSLMNEMKEPGKYQVNWDGRDDTGMELKSGIYFCRITAASFKATRKLILIE
jgi:flagellar hook assembly protein FlgD